MRPPLLIHGDMLSELKKIEANSIDAALTDPPYHLNSIVKRFGSATAAPAKSNGQTGVYARASKGFMGKTWDGGDIAFRPETWEAVLRVLKPGAHMLVFGGTKGVHRMACAIEDAGFELRDTLMWLYGTGFPKSHDVSKGIDKAKGVKREVIGSMSQTNMRGGKFVGPKVSPATYEFTKAATPEAEEWDGYGTALKPAYEPILLVRKPLQGTIVANVLRWGVGALAIDACRIESAGKEPSPVGNYRGSKIGSIGHSGRRDNSSDALGRWPANVLHDGSKEVVAMFPKSSGTGGASPIKSDRSIGTFKEKNNRAIFHYGDKGSAARFFWCPKATEADRNAGVEDFVSSTGETGNTHPTVKPTKLMRYLCRMITPEGAVVLDPFMGSGTTGRAARLEGCEFVGIELEKDSYDIASGRITPKRRRLWS